MEPIAHAGIVKQTSEGRVKVLIGQVSACDMCRARKFCTSADVREKMVDARNPGFDFVPGDRVRVVGKASLGLKAVGVAYVLPMCLMIGVLVLTAGWICPEREALSALCALGVLVLYYAVLCALRSRLRRDFVFTAEPCDGPESETGTGTLAESEEAMNDNN